MKAHFLIFVAVIAYNPLQANGQSWWRQDESAGETCPPSTGFSSFNGMQAGSIADCAWDFFGCSSSPACCQKRYDDCCRFIMDPEGFNQLQQPEPEPEVQEETQPEEVYKHADTLIGCIWQFNGCIEHRRVPEAKCYERFEECKMIIMGMVPTPQPQPQPVQPQPVQPDYAPMTVQVGNQSPLVEPPQQPFRTWVQHPAQRYQPVVFHHMASPTANVALPRPFGYQQQFRAHQPYQQQFVVPGIRYHYKK